MMSRRLPAAVLLAASGWALLAAPAARAAAPVIQTSAGDTIAALADFMAHLFIVGLFINEAENNGPRREYDEGEPPAALAAQRQDGYGEGDDWDRPRSSSRRRLRDAREGFLFSFGLGGGSQLVSPLGRAGALQGNLRLGYGFSDRFQAFMDITGAGGSYAGGTSAASWLFTLRGQTVLIGDRRGNGLNLNLGIGLGGVSTSFDGYQTESPAGLALAGGLSYDFRVSRHFAISPELFAWWHAVPNDRGRERDVASAYGLQLNFLWYGP